MNEFEVLVEQAESSLTGIQKDEISNIRYQEAAVNRRRGQPPEGLQSAIIKVRERGMLVEAREDVLAQIIDNLADELALHGINKYPLRALSYVRNREEVKEFRDRCSEALLKAFQEFGSEYRAGNFLMKFVKKVTEGDSLFAQVASLPDDLNTIISEARANMSETQKVLYRELIEAEKLKINAASKRFDRQYRVMGRDGGLILPADEVDQQRATGSFARGVTAMETGNEAQRKQPSPRREQRTGENSPIGYNPLPQPGEDT